MAQTAQIKTSYSYSRRKPEETPLYKIIQAELETFLSDRQAEGRPLPQYVLDEFEAYTKCGILQHGFLRLQCQDCQQEKIVAFSCKKRGFCPSCCAKRMVEASAHLVDHVLPLVPYRQFVLSFPIPLRYWLNANKKLFAKIHKIVIAEIRSYYTSKALAEGIKNPAPGSVSFTQRFGSDLRLNPHLHILCPDGVYSTVNGKPLFHNIRTMTDADVARLVETISHKVRKYLVKKGYLDKDGELVENPIQDHIFTEYESVNQAVARSLEGRIAFGPNAGKYVTKIGSGFGYGEEIPLAKGKLCYSLHGFSLHCATTTNTHQRDKLEKLIQYMARGPISNERIEITEENQVKLQLKTRYSDGTTHLKFTFGEFIEKLVALIPPPRTHLVRWGGCFAPNSPYRKQITLKPQVKKGFQFGEDDKRYVKNYRWAKMLARVFKIDVSSCQKCGGEMVALAAITDPDGVKRYLKHLGLDTDPPKLVAAKYQSTSFCFEEEQSVYEQYPHHDL